MFYLIDGLCRCLCNRIYNILIVWMKEEKTRDGRQDSIGYWYICMKWCPAYEMSLGVNEIKHDLVIYGLPHGLTVTQCHWFGFDSVWFSCCCLTPIELLFALHWLNESIVLLSNMSEKSLFCFEFFVWFQLIGS